jgi:hypothetical protein
MSLNSERESSRPPVHVILDVAVAATDIQRLLALDRAWTGAEERSGELSDRDREALVVLGNNLDMQIAIVERHALTLREVFDSYRTWINERVRSELNGSHFTDSQRDDIRRILAADNGDFAGRGLAEADLFARRAPIERAELRKKIAPLRGSGPVVTDISPEAFCGIAASGLVADLAVCPETLGVGCAAALGIYLLMEHEGC